MPTYRVTAPDGTRYRVTAPEGASQDEVLARVKAQASGAPSQPAQEAAPQASVAQGKPPSIGERIARGIADPSIALGQVLANSGYSPGYQAKRFGQYDEGDDAGVYDLPGAKDISQKVNADIASREKAYQERRGPDAGIDWVRGGGNIIGSLPLMAMPGGAPGFLKAVGQGALTGAASGALQPVTDDQKSFAEQKATQVGIGAAGGGIFSGLLNIAGRMISPKVSADVAYLRDKGVKMTPGQASGSQAMMKAEDKATSLPVMGSGVVNQQRRATESMNQVALNEALSDIGEVVNKIGHDGIKQVGDKLGRAYDDIVPQLQFRPDNDFAAKLGELDALRSVMSKDASEQLERILTNKVPRKPLSGEGLKELQEFLGKQISRFGRSDDPNNQAIAEGLEIVRDAVMDNMARYSPDVAAKLSSINRGWAKLVRLERAAAMAGNKDGVFTADQLYSAVRMADDSVRKRAIARGTGLMQDFAGPAARVIGGRYPDSGTAGRTLPFALGALGGYGAVAAPGPTAAALGGLAAGRMAYSNTGNDLLASALMNRPQFAPQLAQGIRQLSGPGALSVAALLAGQQ